MPPAPHHVYKRRRVQDLSDFGLIVTGSSLDRLLPSSPITSHIKPGQCDSTSYIGRQAGVVRLTCHQVLFYKYVFSVFTVWLKFTLTCFSLSDMYLYHCCKLELLILMLYFCQFDYFTNIVQLEKIHIPHQNKSLKIKQGQDIKVIEYIMDLNQFTKRGHVENI